MGRDSKDVDLEGAKRLMGVLVRMPPKPHESLKLGKHRKQAQDVPKAKAAKSRGLKDGPS
jgi:hypothetical protein